MEYAISISIVAIFVAIYALTRPKLREVYLKTYNENEYIFQLKEFVQSLPLPKNGGENDSKRLAFEIKKNMLLLKLSRFSTVFSDFFAYKQKIDALCKQNLETLNDLPSIDGEARIVTLARYCLCHSNYMFCNDRVQPLLNEQNKWRTLTIDEILQLESAFCFVLLEKITFLTRDLLCINKMHRLANKYCSNQFQNDNSMPYLKNELFLSICAKCSGYESEYFEKIYQKSIKTRLTQLSTIFTSVDCVGLYDFSRFYTPLEIFDKFDAFCYAPTNCKQNFLKLASKLSSKENIDEFMYAVRIEKYTSSVNENRVKLYRGSLFFKKFAILLKSQDVCLLSASLCSSYFMNMFFGENKVDNKRKRSISILKIAKNKNSFVPIYKFQSVNFGISTLGDKLRISPRLPKQISSAHLTFENKGIQHHLSIERANESELYIDGIKLSGIEEINLGKKSLRVTVKIPY